MTEILIATEPLVVGALAIRAGGQRREAGAEVGPNGDFAATVERLLRGAGTIEIEASRSGLQTWTATPVVRRR